MTDAACAKGVPLHSRSEPGGAFYRDSVSTEPNASIATTEKYSSNDN
ncbi:MULTISPECIES: hypothetical protein [Nostocales]|uniref:Uncharacterized protein n=3 Tax=Nostocales TaxID=1161 RepID=A0A8S9SUN6_9CYAN|nr:hypothetical protein [Tolypothrix bouteillei]KAF3884050.1 hypothetical protein DA73_0400027095 [Tolypothrix bouteillei VB521301]